MFYFPLLFAFVVGGLGFEFCVFVAGWRHALRSGLLLLLLLIQGARGGGLPVVQVAGSNLHQLVSAGQRAAPACSTSTSTSIRPGP